MGIGTIRGFFNIPKWTRKKQEKTNPVDSEGVMAGSDHETREHSDYTEKKKGEAENYTADGKTHNNEKPEGHDYGNW